MIDIKASWPFPFCPAIAQLAQRVDDVITRDRLDELMRLLPLFGRDPTCEPVWCTPPAGRAGVHFPHPTYPLGAASEIPRGDAAVAGASLGEVRTPLTYCERFGPGHRAAVIADGRVAALLRRLRLLRDTVVCLIPPVGGR